MVRNLLLEMEQRMDLPPARPQPPVQGAVRPDMRSELRRANDAVADAASPPAKMGEEGGSVMDDRLSPIEAPPTEMGNEGGSVMGDRLEPIEMPPPPPRPHFTINPSTAREGIILAELLGPPASRRRGR